ncbi:helix-turn-helix transcriptional regulator [Streptomyces abyssomicinicus]|uniref:helix-turn-helix transcriptional regulator n=1 Tax=Streptomyces abyssomicinicus TaxID=574929 RepID=UPI0012505A8A|nr:helix-turn-helix transcriptional regulator [Streptomyces abyssomicinicus]
METRTMSVLGLTSTEEHVYRHFLQNPRTPAGDVAPLIPVDRQEAHRAISRLRVLRLLHGDEESTWATDPHVAVTRLAEGQLETVYRTVRRLTDIWPILESLRADRPEPLPDLLPMTLGRTSTALRRLEDLTQVRARIDQLAFTAHREILAAEPYDALSPDNIAHARTVDFRCLERGVRIRNLVRPQALDDPGTRSYLLELYAGGAEIRVADELFDLMLVYDRRTALLPIDAHDTCRGALCTEESSLVGSLVRLFEKLWDAATDFADLAAPRAEDAPGLSEAQRRVLTAMCTASKDDVGARQAGMSLRTYRRHIAELLRVLDAGSRAQAALSARERGWV